ncbi:sugar phosphate nucleotidyltransferase [Heyndrickxia coagulans]|uniref:sugar phosphate nucleotidyltransferase n=1 Tax=Heyndrickxia coagulans TaxID=1398 RepID=UPI000E486E34|nr:sugar phosphate nucleotidyltransferase [Heyndrickxia coagulans]RGR95827.1 mannose-1-phosphate guanylyltransferase [Heyndrickxia coagulans]
MRLVLLSGGSGKRLWPLSNDARSKQFLKVLKDENGNMQSMVQRVWNQLRRVDLDRSTLIATSKSQVNMINSQLGGKAQVIIEPSRRDTFPAIALSASYLYSKANTSLDEVVAILPVDPYVKDDFFEKVKKLENVIRENISELALIGVNPTFPSSKYGYIIPNKKGKGEIYQVNRFVEKPSAEDAENMIEQGALWNCGVFAFKLSFVINLLKEKGFPTNYEELLYQYEQLPKLSFDYEVVEKTEKICVIPYNGEWKDLGTWNTLTEEMEENKIGKGIISKDSKNTHLINELDIPVTVLGISDAVVAASPDGILVSDKEASPRIKDIMKDVDNRPMFEERQWGWFRILDHSKVNDNLEVLTKRIGIKAGKNLSYQYHFQRNEIWTIIKGTGIVAHNDKLKFINPGDVLKINMGEKHALKATTDLELIEVQAGTQLIEEDTVRVCRSWEEVEQHCYSLFK